MSHDEWAPPRCRHGHILLGCPHDDCPEQSAYLAGQDEQIEALVQTQRVAAREVVRRELGLPVDPTTG